MNDHNYEFHFADPGMFLEIYIPTIYEPQLRQVLLKGMNHEHVQSYLSDPKNMTRIGRLLKKNPDLKEYDIERVRKLTRVLKGYSIYNVDGTFSDKQGITICSEPISVVRLFFLPDLSEENLKNERFWGRRFLRYWTHSPENYYKHLEVEQSRDHLGNPQEPEEFAQEKAFIKKLDEWLKDIDLVVNGYILDSLCCEIKWRKDTGQVANLEQEIWISSFRTLAVNRIILNEPDETHHGC